jgi:hypothetical protein
MPILYEILSKYWRLIAGGVIIAGTYLYAHHTGYGEGLKFELDIHMQYVSDQAKLVKDAELLKLAKEQQDAQHTQEIIAGYDASVATLAQRLRDLQTMSGRNGVQVAGTGQSTSSVSEVSNTTGRVNATFEAKPFAALSIVPSDALGDTLQCEKLQEWVKSIQN